jgi:8-oxo-dGTP pyrophosphatase MutT (NUDIX family)
MEDSKIIFDGNYVNVRVDKVKLPNGKEIDKEIVERIDGVNVLPILEDGHFLLIKQYFPSLGKSSWRLPGGGVDGRFENGKYVCSEDSRVAAQRELREETGHEARDLQLMFETAGSATVRHKVSYYLGKGVCLSDKAYEPDGDEFISLQKIAPEEARRLALNGEFQNPMFGLMMLMATENAQDKIRNS